MKITPEVQAAIHRAKAEGIEIESVNPRLSPKVFAKALDATRRYLKQKEAQDRAPQGEKND